MRISVEQIAESAYPHIPRCSNTPKNLNGFNPSWYSVLQRRLPLAQDLALRICVRHCIAYKSQNGHTPLALHEVCCDRLQDTPSQAVLVAYG